MCVCVRALHNMQCVSPPVGFPTRFRPSPAPSRFAAVIFHLMSLRAAYLPSRHNNNGIRFCCKTSRVQITLHLCSFSHWPSWTQMSLYLWWKLRYDKMKGLDWGQRREWKCKSHWDEDEPVRKDSWSFMSCSILGQSVHWHWKEVIITGPIVICTILIWTTCLGKQFMLKC